MARRPDWPARLAALLSAVETRAFDAHRWNCGRFALAAAMATTGRRPAWRSRVSLEATADSAGFPRIPPAFARVGDVVGKIVSVYRGVTQVGRNSVVALNVGKNDGLDVGHVMSVQLSGRVARDRETNEMVRLPNEPIGQLLVFRTFDKISYGLIVDATQRVATVQTLSPDFQRFRYKLPWLTAGTHTLRFESLAPTIDYTSLLDDPAQAARLQGDGDYRAAVPTPDHFIPLLYFAGLVAAQDDTATVITDGCEWGSLSMTSCTLN